MSWEVYIILCSDDSLYTGISTDSEKRFHQHAAGEGAKYFRGRQPVRTVFLEGGHTRSSSARREAEIKSFSRDEKLQLIANTKSREII